MIDILGDLDGVFADFTSGANTIHGRPLYAVTTWDWYSDWGMTDADFWKPIKLAGSSFYDKYVPPYPWHDELLRLIYSVGDLVIVTANPLDAGLAASKVEWIRKYIGSRVPVITVCGGLGNSGNKISAADLKAMIATPSRVLIDDADHNIDAFRAAGGKAIEFPQPWNRLHHMTNRRIEWVKDCLSFCERSKAA